MRRLAISVAGIASAITIFLVGTAFAAPPVDGTGSPGTCPMKGRVKFKPALVTDGTASGAVKVTAKSMGECSGGTGDGPTISRVKIKGSGTTAANSCDNGTPSNDLAVTIKWKTGKGLPKLTPSTGSFTLQKGAVAADGSQTFALGGTISGGSFTGRQIRAHIETDESAPDLQSACDAKGIKKVSFGFDDEPTSCTNGPNQHAAITAQITTIDGSDVAHLQVQMTTVTAAPFQLGGAAVPTHPSGMILEGASSNCELSGVNYRCTHQAYFASTGACRWNGDYVMDLSYACSPTNTCALCDGDTSIAFSLASEDFCTSTTTFCVADLSCAEATAGSSSGGVPCCSSNYFPLVSCLSEACAAECASAVAGTGGVVPNTPCYTCVFANCHDPYFACSADNADCFTGP